MIAFSMVDVGGG